MKKVLLLIPLFVLILLPNRALALTVIIKYNSVEVWPTSTSLSPSNLIGYVENGEVYDVLDKNVDKQIGLRYQIKMANGQIGWISDNFTSDISQKTNGISQETIQGKYHIITRLSQTRNILFGKVIEVNLIIFNDRKSDISIDPNKIYLKDSESTLLKTLSPDEVCKLLDIESSRMDAIASSQQNMLNEKQQELNRLNQKTYQQQTNVDYSLYPYVTAQTQQTPLGMVDQIFDDVAKSNAQSSADIAQSNIQVATALKISMASDKSSAYVDYLDKNTIIPPQTKLKIKKYYSVEGAAHPFILNIMIGKTSFIFTI